MEVDLGTVECSVSWIEPVFCSCLLQSFLQPLLRKIPEFGVAHRVFRPGGKLNVILETKYILVEIPVQFHYRLYLVLNLIGRTVYVCVILGKSPYSHKSMERSRSLVTVNEAKFSHTKGKFPVAADSTVIHKYTAGTVHGFHSERSFIYLCEIHIFLIMIPVSRTKPE